MPCMLKVYCQELFIRGTSNTWGIIYAVELCLAILFCLHTADIAVELSSRHGKHLEISKAKVTCKKVTCKTLVGKIDTESKTAKLSVLCACKTFNERKIKYGWFKQDNLGIFKENWGHSFCK